MTTTALRRPTSRVYRDLELNQLVDAGLDRRRTYADIRSESLERFGPDRTPSHSSIARYARNRLSRSQLILQNPG
jgi:hypothetical protein